MSPGSTSGTDVMNNLSPVMKFMFKNIMMPIVFPLTGMVHTLENGAKRYIDGISNPDYKSGSFYGSKKGVTGALSDQSELFPDLRNHKFQDNANKAIHRFIEKE
jgi:hypothetical protein